MPQPARLVTTIAAPVPFVAADAAPFLVSRSATRRLVQRGDTELIVQDVDPSAASAATSASSVRFPAPWQAVRDTTSSPSTRTSVITDTRAGSVGFSSDGTLVWGHTRGPLASDHGRGADQWLVIAFADGTVLARARTDTAAEGSHHVPHPDPAQMGLSIGEGQDGAPLRWGRWDGQTLDVHGFGDEDRVLLAVSPSGDRLLTVTHDQAAVALHRATDGTLEAELSADDVPRHPAAESEQGETYEDDEMQAFFDYEGGFLDEHTVVVGTVESDEEFGSGRHWLVDAASMRLTDQVAYPFEVSGLPHAPGDGTWYTVSRTEQALHVRSL